MVCQPRNHIKKAKIARPAPTSFDEEVNDHDGGDNEQVEKDREQQEDGEEEIFECPTCKKRFTSKYGRKYHVGEFLLWIECYGCIHLHTHPMDTSF